MILLVDNYDSFTFNVQRYLVQLHQDVHVMRNDDARLRLDIAQFATGIVISPGPKAPQQAGFCIDLIRRWSGQLPILGVCLGHQAIVEALGGRIVRAVEPVHGRATPMKLAPSRLFADIPSGTPFSRYHSLIAEAESLPEWLRPIAWSDQGEIMAVEHREHPTFGVQFHPESVLSLDGHRLLQNFLLSCGLARAQQLPELDLSSQQQVFAPTQSDLAAALVASVPLPKGSLPSGRAAQR